MKMYVLLQEESSQEKDHKGNILFIFWRWFQPYTNRPTFIYKYI